MRTVGHINLARIHVALWSWRENQVADLLGVNADEVFFTSGATESNNIAIQGLREYAENSGKNHIVTTAIEHKAVLETLKQLEKEGFMVDFIDPD